MQAPENSESNPVQPEPKGESSATASTAVPPLAGSIIDDYPLAKMLPEVMNRLPLSPAMNDFVGWMTRKGIEFKASGAIGPRALLLFLAAWSQEVGHGLASFYQEEFPGKTGVMLAFAYEALEQNQLALGVSGYPYISKECEDVMLEAQTLAKELRRDEIEPQHTLAALLLSAAKNKDGDAFLGLNSGRLRQLMQTFFAHVRDSGYGEAWNFWHRTFSPYIENAPAGGESKLGSQPSPAAKEIPIPPIPVGKRFAPKRDSTDEELCLNIDAYAGAIADTFSAAQDENDFVFALYAPWGRGKSTLIKKVAEILGGDGGVQNKGRGYRPIFFSAWKFPTRPEVWVYLYQKIAAIAQEGGTLQKYRIGFRMGLLQHGWSPLIWGLLLLAVSRLYFEATHWLFEGVGLVGVIIVGSFLWNAGKFGKQVSHTYLSTPDHGEKLGLQAVIGRDLKDLLNVWIRPKNGNRAEDAYSHRLKVCDFSQSTARWYLGIVLILAWLTVGLVSWKLYRHLAAVEAQSLSQAAGTNTPPFKMEMNVEWKDTKAHWSGLQEAGKGGKANESGANWSNLVVIDGILGFIALSASIFLISIALPPKRYERVLLVVDDLDRCEPDQMLAVIESLRLFLDESEMSRRMQVAMLLDRTIFRRAVIEKGTRCHALEENAPAETKIRYFREQEEKLFVALLELPPLDQSGMQELVQKILKQEVKQQFVERRRQVGEGINKERDDNQHIYPVGMDDMAATQQAAEFEKSLTDQQQEKHKAMVAEENDALKSFPPVKELEKSEKSNVPPPDIAFSEEEIKLLQEIAARLEATSLTPRSLRALVLRYQLLRLILQRLGQWPGPDAVLNGLVNRLLPGKSLADENIPKVVRDAVALVAGQDDGEELKTPAAEE